MSDDEEIICKGRGVGLCSYLSDLGYVDFETFDCDNAPGGDQSLLHNECPFDKYKIIVNNAVSSPNAVGLQITTHDYRKLVTILNSQLLFKEDAVLIESLLHNKPIFNQEPNYTLHAGVLFTGILSSIIALRIKVNLSLVQYVVPAGLTAMFTCYSAWKFFKEFNENRKDKILISHINDLKNVSSNILKLTRFVKEIEILSNSVQVPVTYIGSDLYLPSYIHKITDLSFKVSPHWKTLPHLRKCLSDGVEEALNMLTLSVNSLRQSLFDEKLVGNNFRYISNQDGLHLKPCQSPEKECCSVTLLDLKTLTSKYLSVQSDYLKELALIFSPRPVSFKDNLSAMSSCKFTRDKVFEMFMSLHNKLTGISFKLMMQYEIHNIASTSNKVSYKPVPRSHHMKEINELQNGVHNVFLLLYSALLRVRNLEETLENLLETDQSQEMKGKLSLDVKEKFTVLKDDLISTVRCYDVLCQQATSKTTMKPTKQDADNGCIVIQEDNIKETGIIVGTSDFTVNSPDEVFLSLSGAINNEEAEASAKECVDDWCLERKPQIPKTLLTELSQTLKSRKTDFKEREKDALKRKGLRDIDNLSSPSDEDSDESDTSFLRKQDHRGSVKRHIPAQDYSHSSDSDDEMDPFESGSFLTKLKLCKKYQSEPYSDSESSVDLNKKTTCENEVPCGPSVSASSLANLAAVKSQMWGKYKEEYYSDGSES